MIARHLWRAWPLTGGDAAHTAGQHKATAAMERELSQLLAGVFVEVPHVTACEYISPAPHAPRSCSSRNSCSSTEIRGRAACGFDQANGVVAAAWRPWCIVVQSQPEWCWHKSIPTLVWPEWAWASGRVDVDDIRRRRSPFVDRVWGSTQGGGESRANVDAHHTEGIDRLTQSLHELVVILQRARRAAGAARSTASQRALLSATMLGC